jgi:CO/xanthine dehydrogenase FAD-binding subunit
MIPLLDEYQLVTPGSLQDALADLARHPASRPFAGGTDLMVVLEAGHLPPGRYVSLQNCRELVGIEETKSGISIGALTTYTQIRNSAVLAERYPLLPMAAAETGGLATQNRGTIGGNIANASPAADTPPALLVYDAELELMSASCSRRIPYAAFHQGYKKMDLEPGEIIARIHLPPRPNVKHPKHPKNPKNLENPENLKNPNPKNLEHPEKPENLEAPAWRDYYRKVGTRRAQAIAKVCFAGSIVMEGDNIKDVRIALGSVAPTVVRATRTEDALRGKQLNEEAIAAAASALVTEIAPIDDIRSTARYRARVAANLVREFLTATS